MLIWSLWCIDYPPLSWLFNGYIPDYKMNSWKKFYLNQWRLLIEQTKTYLYSTENKHRLITTTTIIKPTTLPIILQIVGTNTKHLAEWESLGFGLHVYSKVVLAYGAWGHWDRWLRWAKAVGTGQTTEFSGETETNKWFKLPLENLNI